MQSTGLKDKNEILIYEGDIIKAFLDDKRGYAITVVWYFAPQWMMANYTTGKLKGSFEMMGWGAGKTIDKFEIIGNRYQHTELIEVKDD